MESFHELVNRLKQKTGSYLMTPAQLEAELGVSVKKQSKLRKEDRFPIPHKQMGRNVVYSIHKVAEFLLDGEIKTPTGKDSEMNTAIAHSKRKTPSGIHDMSYLVHHPKGNT